MMGNHAKMPCEGQLKAVLAISPFIATLCPGKTAGFLSFITFQVPFTIVVKAFQAALEFINAHLQQCDQVTTVLRTVGFWLIVC